ncbi:unnamed protein product [Adineta steineri]|uniref:CABIT domain-containing protein n=1 Tax=Adineta steineri TaxID=433720 RepID=A0A814BDS2_9BILA|nr:unnamed protein product [Adineta steineri]CAF3665594.1 unnamed protein product [Adineta steineri]
MHYVLNDQSFYFPSSNDQSYALRQFLAKQEYQLPLIVRVSSSNIDDLSIKNFLSKNIPLLLLNVHQFRSILSEYYTSNDSKHHSNKYRLTLTQGKLLSKQKTKYRTMKKLSKSLVTVASTNLEDENSDDDYFKTRTIVRNLNEKRSTLAPLCRIPITYQRFFEVLNENDQAIEPFHKISDLLIIEYSKDDNNQDIRIEKWPQSFFLRSTCKAYTKRYIPDENKLSASSDSCYGSLSDLDSQRNLLILNDNKQILQPGQVIKILNQCSAYCSQTSKHENQIIEQPTSPSSTTTTSWLRNKSRFFFPRKKTQPTQTLNKQSTINNIYDIPKISEPYLKCQIEQGDIVYISIYEIGLFSPIYSKNHRVNSLTDSENLDISGVFQLKELLTNFRFPISVRLVNNSIKFENIYSPSTINHSESSFLSSTKFRLLLPYIEDVIFACPLIVPSCFKSETLVIPIPINNGIKIQRCLNMREISKNKDYINLIEKCSHIIHQYETEFSYIHFPLILNTPTKHMSKSKQPLFKKRSRSESHIDYQSTDLNKDNYRKSCDILDHNNEFDTDENDKQEQVDHVNILKPNVSNTADDYNQENKPARYSSYYAKIKIDKPRRYCREQDQDTDDENYRDLDHIYDYIRSGDVTDDVQKIQAKEQAISTKNNQINNISKLYVSAVRPISNSTIKNSEIMKRRQVRQNLDDSRPLDNESDENNKLHTNYSSSRRHSVDVLSESRQLKPITQMKRISKH